MILLTIFILVMATAQQETTPSKIDTHLTYLALGDSYTIGEKVEAKENFPNQLVRILNSKTHSFSDPDIVAQTGWTTDELQAAINKSSLRARYDFVTLLIGVNDQYRGRSLTDYMPQFESLLKRAIHFAGDDTNHVIVVSIPDWGVTPFAEGRDRAQIAREIDEYNAANEKLSGQYHVHYINITKSTREAVDDPSLLTSDGLHPSGKEYAKWALLASNTIVHVLSR